MNLSPPKSQQPPSNVASSPIILPLDLITELLSFLPVKSLLQFRCVCMSWKILISDSFFVKLHLQRSIQNPRLAVTQESRECSMDVIVSPTSLSHLLENPSKPTTLTNDPYYSLNDKDCRSVAGSCNGLLCLLGLSEDREMWLRFWNPATRAISDKLGHYPADFTGGFEVAFGYDNSTDTYKVVYLQKGMTGVFSLGDNVWRNIESFPLGYYLDNRVHLRDSLNWLGLRSYVDDCDDYDCEYITSIEQFMIVALDLRTETCKELLLPRGFDEVPCYEPSLCVLMDCICFSHLVKKTHLVIWKMMDYGDDDSWTQLLEINLQILKKIDEWSAWVPLHLSKNYDTLILGSTLEHEFAVYNLRDGSIEKTRITNGESSWIYINDYVESLVFCH
ncbi:putative F-box domain-containing protein [Medicago truncatula]|uniref:F-box protein interaction domain protein n=1 Tax=Medicago truncatula TaxID=3880 RepID=G7L4H1_MEDTR|nr:F-box/kelch-repeat protein At3g23880 [Medicago truncatula]AES79305.2 F-box protein interaction domain protein [Medicago truncatula]RHN46100.1 putative F-box domain-containing protein [Medicago truncatula]